MSDKPLDPAEDTVPTLQERPGRPAAPSALPPHPPDDASHADEPSMSPLEPIEPLKSRKLSRRDHVSDDSHTVGMEFDGSKPAEGLTALDPSVPLSPPVQNKPGRRHPLLYRSVLDQFGPTENPRYAPDARGDRAHIYVWDVTRAMGCEVPHFVGPKELSLSDTVDWLRRKGDSRGWRRCTQQEAVGFADLGQPVVVIPKDPILPSMGLLRPTAPSHAGEMRLSAAGPKRGSDLSLPEALGTEEVIFLAHR